MEGETTGENRLWMPYEEYKAFIAWSESVNKEQAVRMAYYVWNNFDQSKYEEFKRRENEIQASKKEE